MKKFLSLTILSVMLLLLIVGCDGGSSADQPFGFFISHQTNAFTSELTAAVVGKAEELGVEVTVYDAEKDPAKQISQIENAVNQGIAGILIEPVSVDGLVPALAAAKEAGVPVVVVNQRISDHEPQTVSWVLSITQVVSWR